MQDVTDAGRLDKKRQLYLVPLLDRQMFKVGITNDLRERLKQLKHWLFDWHQAYVIEAAEDSVIEALEEAIKKLCRSFRVGKVPALRTGHTEVFWIAAWARALQIVACFESEPAFGLRKRVARFSDEVAASVANALQPPESKSKPPTGSGLNGRKMSMEIARRLYRINLHVHELEIMRAKTLQKNAAYSSLDADQRRVIDYMCRSFKIEEIERDRRIWRLNFGLFRKLFPNPKTREEVEAILDRLVKSEFQIRQMETGTEEKFSWFKQVYYCDNGSIEIEVSPRIAEYHRLPITTEAWAAERYTRYYITVPLALLLQHQNLFHFVLERLKNTRLKLSVRSMEITIEELRYLWGLSPDTKPYDLERYWLKDACERISVATPIRILRYEPLRSPTRGRPVYAYRLQITEETKTDFLKRFERSLEVVKQQAAH